MNFKEWLLILEELKPKALALKILGNQVDNSGKIIFSTDPNIKNITKQFNDIFIASKIPEAQQKNIYPTAAYVYKTDPSVNEEEFSKDLYDYYNFVIAKKLPILSFDDKTGNVIGNNPYLHYNDWANAIHSKNSENKDEEEKKHQKNLQSTGDVSDQELIAQSPDGKIKVYKANSVDKCIILGKGKKFCISQPGNSRFHSYRNTKDSTFYFVYDNTRNDNLSVVVVDITKRGIEITDISNKTDKFMQDPYVTDKEREINSDPNLYLKYLQEKGIDTTIFKNEPKTAKEEEEHKKLGSAIRDLTWFKSLTPEERKSYIGRGHELSDEQFNWLVSIKSESLLKIYVSTGIILRNKQLSLVLNDNYFKDLKLNYLTARIHGIPDKKLQISEYLAMPSKYTQELIEKYGDELKSYINEDEKIKIKDYISLPEDKKIEFKKIFGNQSREYILSDVNFFKTYRENPNLEFTDEIKDSIDCSTSWFINEILSQPNKNNVKHLINILTSTYKCKDIIDNILEKSDSLQNNFKVYKSDKSKIINLLYLLSNYSTRMPINNIGTIIYIMNRYLGNAFKYIVMFREFFRKFAESLENASYYDEKEISLGGEPLLASSVSMNNTENKTFRLFHDIIYTGINGTIDNNAISTIKFIVDTIGKEKFPKTTKGLIKDITGEEAYKVIFPEKQQQASPEQIDKAYRGDSTREARDYKF